MTEETVKKYKAFQRFFDRCAKGQKPGYPRFRGRNHYDSFPYPDGAGWKLDQPTRPPEKKGMVRVHLTLMKIGTVKLHMHRDMRGTVKTLTIEREGEHWSACLSCDMDTPEALPPSCEDGGRDLGVTHVASLSTGEFFENTRHDRRADKNPYLARSAAVQATA